MLSRDRSAARSRPSWRPPSATVARSRRCARTFPDIDVVDAYEIQLLNIRAAPGARGGGHGPQGRACRRKAMQEMMGVDEPDYGHLLSDMELSPRTARSSAGRYCYPRVEVEVGFVLGDDAARRGLHRGRRDRGHRGGRPGHRADRQPDRATGRSGWRTRSPTTPRRPATSSAPERVKPTELDLPRDRRPPAPQRRAGRRPAAPTPCSATRSPRSPGWRARSRRSGCASRPAT